MTPKTELRKLYREKRQQIPESRRLAAAQKLLARLGDEGNILSFASFGSELDLWPLNRKLASKNCLFLPAIIDHRLVPYQVTDLNALSKSPMGFLEPNPALCRKAGFAEIALILVPGLCFDSFNTRLGYGLGHYDRFLTHEHNTLGIGFEEQLTNTPLPKDPWDVPLKSLLLV